MVYFYTINSTKKVALTCLIEQFGKRCKRTYYLKYAASKKMLALLYTNNEAIDYLFRGFDTDCRFRKSKC